MILSRTRKFDASLKDLREAMMMADALAGGRDE
jgi:hypothetical protein